MVVLIGLEANNTHKALAPYKWVSLSAQVMSKTWMENWPRRRSAK
jgi:hypothetical protein